MKNMLQTRKYFGKLMFASKSVCWRKLFLVENQKILKNEKEIVRSLNHIFSNII